MQNTANYKFKKPENIDLYNVQDMNDNMDAIDTALSNIQTTSKATLNTAGWYRVAEYKSGAINTEGNLSNSCEITLKRGVSSYGGTYRFYLESHYQKQEFKVKSVDIALHALTKIRYTRDTNTNTAYIEVYATTTSTWFISIDNGKDETYCWKAITPTLTEETVSGVTVTTTYDIPANASPVTDLDLNLRTLPQEMPSGTDLNDCIESGVYFFSDNVSKYVNTPSADAHNGILVVNKRILNDSIRIAQTYISCNNNGGMFYRTTLGISDSDWYAWKKVATTADLANYLSLSGGTVEAPAGDTPLKIKTNGSDATYLGFVNKQGKANYIGFDSNGEGVLFGKGSILHTGNIGEINSDVTVKSTSATARALAIQNSLRKITHYIDANGVYHLLDVTNGGKAIINSAKDGSVTYAGGTISRNGNVPLLLDNTTSGATSCYLAFKGNGTTIGSIGSDNGKMVCVPQGMSSAKELLHEGNYTDYNEFSKGISLTNATADEGGEIRFASPVTDHAFGGMITQDIWRNMMRIFATHDGKTKLFNIDFASMKEGGNEALHTGNSAKVLVQSTPLTEAGSVRVW